MRSEDARLSRLHSEQPTTAPSLRDHLVAAGRVPDTMRFLRFNEQAFLNARTLEFPFPGPQAT